MDERKIIIGLVILAICCILAVLIIIFWSNPDIDCEGGICPPPEGFDNDKK